MSYTVLITPEAERQLRENAEWWAKNRSAEQAERWYDGFMRSLESTPRNARLRGRTTSFHMSCGSFISE